MLVDGDRQRTATRTAHDPVKWLSRASEVRRRKEQGKAYLVRFELQRRVYKKTPR